MALEKHVIHNEWKNLVKKLFENKKSITKKEVEKTMKKYHLNPHKINDKNTNALGTMFSWESILNAFENKDSISDVELYKKLEKEYNKK